MKKKKHVNIPIFIPELACPHQCVFCNQQKISGTVEAPPPSEINNIVNQYLSTISNNTNVEIAFFGGSFTGIPLQLQEEYLIEANKFIKLGKVQSIRLSTRPDYIDNEILDLLEKYGVKTIELGAQSTDNTVLLKSGRGHSYDAIENAAFLIKKRGFDLGLQMMIGLPGDSLEKSIKTAQTIVKLKADNTRIYPTIIVKGTALEKLYQTGRYKPLSIPEAVIISKAVYKIFEENNITILRVGLHPSDELTEGKSYIAGPLHNSFKELVMSSIWKDIITEKIKNSNKQEFCFEVNSKQINYAIGYKKENIEHFAEKNIKIKFKSNPLLSKYQINDCSN